MVEMEILGLSSLVRLGSLYRGHERVRDGRVVDELGGGDPVERDAQAQVQGLEL